MNLSDQRFTQVPWLAQSDLEVGRRQAWEIDYRHDEDRASCWQVEEPFHETPHAFLILHAVRGNGNDGGTITLAISDSPRYDVYAKETFAMMRVQSNPRRDVDENYDPA